MRIAAILFRRNGNRYRVRKEKEKSGEIFGLSKIPTWKFQKSVLQRAQTSLLDRHRRRRCLPLSFSPFTMPPAVKPDSFLTELHKMFERTKAKGSISLTTSRSTIEGSFRLFCFWRSADPDLLDLLRAKLPLTRFFRTQSSKQSPAFSQQTSRAGKRGNPTR